MLKSVQKSIARLTRRRQEIARESIRVARRLRQQGRMATPPNAQDKRR